MSQRVRLLALGLLLPLALAAQGHSGKHRRAEIVVVDPAFDCAAVGRVVLNQHAGTAVVGDTVQITGKVYSSCNVLLPSTGPSAQTITFVSRAPSIATVTSTAAVRATVTGVTAGTTRVVGSIGTKKDSLTMVVTAPSAPPPPIDTLPCVAGATTIVPGDNIQTKVNAQGTGTAFTICDGVYRMQSVVPKTGDSFLGRPGATLSGARVLTGWTVFGSTWYVGGQSQQNPYNPVYACQAGHEGCYLPEQLWVNDTLYEHKLTLAAVAAGSQSWYFDYAADRIYLGRNPSGQTIETSVTPVAFTGTATGVTLTGLTIQRYASASPPSTVNGSTAASWTMDSLVVQDNHGSAVATGTHGKLRWSRVLRQGQMGYKAQGTGGLIYGNEFGWNNTAGFGPGGASEAGAGKAARTDSLIFRRNWSHDNDGPGIWYDIDNRHGVIDTNTVEDNDWRGIFYEISYTGIIRGNISRRNGFHNPAASVGACDGAGIIVSSSSGVEVMGNTVADNLNGICNQETDRPAGPYGAHNLTNVSVHDNTVTQTDGGRAAGATDQDPSANPYAPAANNVWANNTYHRTLGTTKWRWSPNADISESAWRLLQDAGSTFGP